MINYKSLANDLINHIVEGWSLQEARDLLLALGYSESDLEELDLEKDKNIINDEIELIFLKSIGDKSNSYVYDYDKDEWFGGDPFRLFANALEQKGYTLDSFIEESDNVYYTINGVKFVSSREVINVFELDENGHHGGWEYVYRAFEEEQE